ncbi:MAG: fibronectin type III domain-containing protein [Phycisphaerae bacterium]|nr:fibronectin type III domain-containing protein [Phycisphaerae bacterium]
MSRRKLFQVFVAAVVAICMLALSDPVSAQRRNDQEFDRARQTQVRHTDELMAQDGVVGTAVGLDESGRHAILVLLERPGVAGIPTDLEGVPVRPLVTGKIYARAKPAAVPTRSGRDTTPPAVPSGLTAKAISSSQINLVWKASSNASYYRVYRSMLRDDGTRTSYTRIATNVKSTAYSSTGLTSGTIYYYVVTAVDKSGHESGYSNEASATTLMPARWCVRPVPIGVSTGHPLITAGTIGCRVIDASGKVYALSNNHVYANENNAHMGDNVLQPGVYDGGVDPRDAIGTLSALTWIDFSGGPNTTDAAIALCLTTPAGTPMVGTGTPTGGYGIPKSGFGVAASVGMAVQKYGRTSSLTKGTITGTNVTVTVGYSSGTALFVNQIIVQSRSAFIKGGDSGSLLVTYPGKEPVGLLFAGNGSGTYAVANNIGDVLTAFDSLGYPVWIDGEQ